MWCHYLFLVHHIGRLFADSPQSRRTKDARPPRSVSLNRKSSLKWKSIQSSMRKINRIPSTNGRIRLAFQNRRRWFDRPQPAMLSSSASFPIRLWISWRWSCWWSGCFTIKAIHQRSKYHLSLFQIRWLLFCLIPRRRWSQTTVNARC